MTDVQVSAFIQARVGGMVSKKYQQRYIFSSVQPLKDLGKYKDIIHDQPTWHQSTTLINISRRYQSRDDPHGASSIPSDIAIPYFTEAIRWITDLAPHLISAKTAISAAMDKARELSTDYDQISRCGRQALKRRMSLRSFPAELSATLGNENLRTFNRLIIDLETAAGLIVQGMTGVRASELMTFTPNSKAAKRLDDGRIVMLLRGRLYKTAPTPAGVGLEWVAGFKDGVNPVELAVNVLSALRSLSTRTEIPFLLQNNTKSHRPLSTPSWNHRLNEFNRRTIGLHWQFASHQFRRTFARFVAIGNKDALFALQTHFKHLSYVMTDIYSGSDLELLALVQDERASHVATLLEAVVGSASLGGRLGREISAVNSNFRGRAGAKIRQDFLHALLSSSDLSVLDHYYGLCVRLLDRALCRNSVEEVGVSLCLKCPNFVVDSSHSSFWQSRVEDNQQLLDSYETSMSDASRTDLTRVIAEAKAVLDDIRNQR